MPNRGTVLYIGGFELPDRNAAAQRVIGIAKSLRAIGYEVKFVNALKECSGEPKNTEYFGFSTLEYRREGDKDYLFGARKAISIIQEEKPTAVIAYNYPAIALNRIRKYCQSNHIKCVVDVTEWPKPVGGSIIYRIIKELDTAYRMRYVQKRVDSVIAISRFLYDYYKSHVPTVLIPPTVDISDEKWNVRAEKNNEVTSFAYAGSPSALKEKLDVVVKAIQECAKTEKIVFNVVGITKQQFTQMYSWREALPEEVVFWGRIPHTDVIRIVKEANWSIILRENNIVVKAGFPTKFVESISCGTPVIANKFSNITDYLNDQNGMLIDDYSRIFEIIQQACKQKPEIDRTMFDFRNYEEIVNKSIQNNIKCKRSEELMKKRKVLVMMYKTTSLGGPTNAARKLMNSSLQEKYYFIPYYFTDKLGKIPRLHVVRKLAAEIKEINPDVIYYTGLQLQGFYVAISAAYAGFRKRTVMAVRGSSCDVLGISRSFYFIFRHIIEPITLRLTEITHTVCTEMAEKKMLKDNMRNFGGVIYNMAPLKKKDTQPISRAEVGLSNDDIVLIYTGRLVDDKGIPFLLEAMSQVTHNQKLLLVGDGLHKAAYVKKCDELGISDRVCFLGHREDVFQLLAASDIYVFPTLHENLSNSLLEAGTMKLPMIATNVGGNPEIIDDGVEGVLVTAGSSESLRKAIEELTVDPEKRKKMGEAAFHKMEQVFAPEIILDEIDRLFDSIR